MTCEFKKKKIKRFFSVFLIIHRLIMAGDLEDISLNLFFSDRIMEF